MAKINQFDAKAMLMADINSISKRDGIRETIGNIANTISQASKAVSDTVELCRYELIDMKVESRNRLMEKYNA